MPATQTRPHNTAIVLDEHFTSFIDQQVQSGHYASIHDVMQAGLRLLEEHETKVNALEAALVEGEQSGEPHPLDFEAFKARMRAEHERA